MKTSSITKRAFTLSAIVCMISGAYACSSSDDSGNGAQSSGNDAGPSTNDASTGDGSTPTSDGGPTGADSGLPYVGTIAITSYVDTTGGIASPMGIFNASFALAAPPPGCTQSVEGICTVTDCTNAVAGFDAGPTPTAGVITISGGLLASPATLTANANGLYSPMEIDGNPFSVGTTYSISAAGGTIPAFSGTSAAGVGDITLTAPLPTGDAGTGSGLYTVDRSSDLDFAWTGGAAGATIALSMFQNAITVECAADSGAGSATVTKATLSHFPASSKVGFLLISAAAKTVTTSDAVVTVSLNGSATSGSITLE